MAVHPRQFTGPEQLQRLGIRQLQQLLLVHAFGDPAKFGKQTGGDIMANKKTFLMIKALEHAPRRRRYIGEVIIQRGIVFPAASHRYLLRYLAS